MTTPLAPAPPGVLFANHLRDLHARCLPALEAEGFDSLVVHSGATRYAFLDDQAYPFRVNPHFAWWAPLTDAPGCFVHVRPGRKPKLLFHAAQDYWHKPPALPREAWVSQFEVVPFTASSALRDSLVDGGRVAFIGEPFAGLDDCGFAAVNPERLLIRLHDARTRKTAWEQFQQRLASHRGAEGHSAALACYRRGGSEFEIHQAFLAGSRQRELDQPYGAIVGTGRNAATLHYQALERAAPGPSLLIDAGAQEHGYASDITRTYPAAEGEFAALIGRMEELQQSLCAAVRPGVDWRDLHQTAHLLLAELLRDAELIRIDPTEALERGVTRLFLPHGLGHLLGLQVHDVGGFHVSPDTPPQPPPPDHPHLRLTRVLEQDFVVTMEPGLYFIDLLLEPARQGPLADAIDWPTVERLRPFGGIRVEDNLLVTLDGHENLTRQAFAALAGQVAIG
ncbi:MAG: Xaa-Pro dipeptidase [Steroidobacteraceae bacterium]